MREVMGRNYCPMCHHRAFFYHPPDVEAELKRRKRETRRRQSVKYWTLANLAVACLVMPFVTRLVVFEFEVVPWDANPGMNTFNFRVLLLGQHVSGWLDVGVLLVITVLVSLCLAFTAAALVAAAKLALLITGWVVISMFVVAVLDLVL